MIKLLALDIDGTLLKKDYSLSEKVKTAVKAASFLGVKVVLVTGRMHSAATFIADELGLDTPILTYSGALARYKDEIFYEKSIPGVLVKEVLTELKKFDTQVNLYFHDELYSETETPVLIDYCQKRKLNYIIKPFDEIENIHATKILSIGKTLEETTEVLEYLQKKFENELCVVRSLPIFCEIINKEASKGNAILFMAKKWGIAPQEIMAIGDQDNDIELLKVAAVKVAMGNASEGLKAVATYVAPSVEEDGVAVAIEKFILLKGESFLDENDTRLGEKNV